jgi:hypothetical protein
MLKTSIVSALALAAMTGIAQASPDAFALPMAISFDGYCDGVTGIQEFPNSGMTTATHAYENCSGYTDTPMVGPMAMKMNGSKIGVAATDGSYPQFGLTFLYIIKNDHTWNLLSPEGGMINMGTWSTGYEATGVQGVPSFTH